MDIKNKIKSAFTRLMGKPKTGDSELGADEVVKKEVFPKTAKAKAKTTTAKKPTVDKKGCTRKPPSKRTRPTNNDYQMIDPDNDTADAGKS
ncbi:MAG: hypothetical protein K2I75_02810 [Clostridiales bacterium]|nr:hypothetical protein [Clostridiales bacterium]